MAHNPYGPKLTEAQRRELVEEVRHGKSVSRASADFGIATATGWYLVKEAALRLLLAQVGRPGVSADDYLRLMVVPVSSHAVDRGSEVRGRSTGTSEPDVAAVAAAATAAARALERFVETLGGGAEMGGSIGAAAVP